jgi:predicted DNA-binding protein
MIFSTDHRLLEIFKMIIEIPLHIEKQITHIAEVEHTPVSTWIAEKLARIIEDYEDLQAVNTALVEIEHGESKFLSLDDAMRVIYELDN